MSCWPAAGKRGQEPTGPTNDKPEGGAGMLCGVRVFWTVCGGPCGIRLWIGKFWGQEELCSRGVSVESLQKGSVGVRRGDAISRASPEESEFVDAMVQAGIHTLI